MAHSCSSTSSTQLDLYMSDIITGAHGDRYQKDLALLMFERATSHGYDFRLGYEMAIADKFDDVAFFDKIQNRWILVQTKHVDTSKGRQPPLKFEMLFPQDECTREKGDFSLFKYLKSYLTVQENIRERKNVVIFTNRDLLVNREMKSVEIEPRLMDEIFRFELGSNVGFKVKEVFIKEMVEYVNRDFNSLRNSIIKLFKEGIIDQVINNFKTPVSSILMVKNDSVKFSETHSSEACQMLASLGDVIDIQTAQLPLEKCKELFVGKSRNKTWPLSANADTVQQFFQDLILSVRQPNDLRELIDRDLRAWMRTWIQPEYFERLEEPQLEMVVSLKKFFNERQSPVENGEGEKSYKKFLQLIDGKEFFDSIREDLKKQLHNLSNYSNNDASSYYVNREIEYFESSEKVLTSVEDSDRNRLVKRTIRDDEFVKELYGKFKHQRFFILAAEPGMGKSTILEYIALAAQRTSSDNVYLFNLSTLNQKLSQVNEGDTFYNLLSMLETALSETNFRKLRQNMIYKTDKRKYFLIFDGLDEVFPSNRMKVIAMLKNMSNVPNVKILASARRAVRTLMETELKVEAMGLMSFNNVDQINFLRKFWKVCNENESIFRKYVTHLIRVFRCDINRTLCEFTGSPLVLKILAEMYADHFEEYLSSVEQYMEELQPQETFSSLKLYEQFVKKCFNNKLRKKSVNFLQGIDEEYDSLFKTFILEHQLLAIKYLQIDVLQTILKDARNAEKLNCFECRIISGTEKSLFVESIGNNIRFVHRSYAEFLAAKFLYCHMENNNVEIFDSKSEAQMFDEYSMLRMYFFTMIEDQFQRQHLKYLKKHYKKNSRIALWACEVHGQKTLDFLLSIKCDPSIINELLFITAEHNYYNICTYLLENHQVSVDCKFNGWTPLQIAAEQGHVAVTKILIEHCGNVNVKDADGWTPLHLAAQNGHLEVFKVLVNKSGDIREAQTDDWTPLHLACQHGHTDIVKLLIDLPESDVNATDIYEWTPLHLAAHNGYLEVVKILLENGADDNAKLYSGLTPLHLASSNDHCKIVQLLIEYHKTPLHFAAQNGYTDVVRMLVDIPRNVDSKYLDGATPLHDAAHNGHLEVVRILIGRCEDINAKDQHGATPLHYAAQNGHTDIVKLLLDFGADIYAKDFVGYTPLDYAVLFCRTDTVQTLSECMEPPPGLMKDIQPLATSPVRFSQEFRNFVWD